ncbi:hypothetical protein ABI_15330 [Asticcacaulis biprosthecium C19]|uniref:Uncharacterized protein n=2 Tax=Asticcacaulis biprosthecium TaxID=76891 RepID=F4QJB0_9CAUL|nr:hypothetical protein ABI_15330 [Asticcacaulis biprosthecium C19]
MARELDEIAKTDTSRIDTMDFFHKKQAMIMKLHSAIQLLS